MQIGGEMGAGDVDGGAAAAQWDAQQWQACVMVPAVDGQQAVDINNELIEAKKGQLRAVAEEVHALHELMNDLGQIVAIQGGQVSHAASLAHKVHDDVAAAREELEQADRDQQKGGCVVS